MKAPHTPGPWEAKGMNVFAGRDCIAICDTDNARTETMAANARLAAAAPDLLAALKAAQKWFVSADVREERGDDSGVDFLNDEGWNKAAEILDAANAAIAKATGGV